MTPVTAHLRRHLARYLLLLMSATTALGLLLWAIVRTEPGCLAAQGHWSSTAGQCHTRLCLLQGDCGQSAAPITGCAKVKRGDSRGRVYFHLGNPLPGAGNAAQWPDSKAGNSMILARFEDDRLVSLACPVTP
ncbi:hypothetical protein [Stenotrophomonas rhizophila]|uniref:hypothetical protein n=1 Tax=Stenotrophomonas rhizophila TaxID=216778 RepID=UPI001E64E020|nr:hypothetical protein [Stenotrophomonas rhizophila]MCC7632943.1 hypothetical protein [Stenotrophomonas rhizophila]MCC7662332.1 hypothetical protein [Stenotrophomonas rhizophila]